LWPASRSTLTASGGPATEARTGRERSKHFTRKGHAERWLAGVTTSVVRGEWADPALSTISLSEWASRWLQGQTHLKPSTRARYEGLLTKHVAPRSAPPA